jgi:hypothetical protein
MKTNIVHWAITIAADSNWNFAMFLQYFKVLKSRVQRREENVFNVPDCKLALQLYSIQAP